MNSNSNGSMPRHRKIQLAWLVAGCVLFTAAGVQLVGTAWANHVSPTAHQVRGQSPEARDMDLVDLDTQPEPSGTSRVTMKELVLYLAIFMLAIFVGFEVITKVPPTLHTPLMSGSNAISGITLVGAIIVAGNGWGMSSMLGMIAVALAMINVAGGFLVTHRMLSMFQAKKKR